jgi:hypothetical protein
MKRKPGKGDGSYVKGTPAKPPKGVTPGSAKAMMAKRRGYKKKS